MTPDQLIAFHDGLASALPTGTLWMTRDGARWTFKWESPHRTFAYRTHFYGHMSVADAAIAGNDAGHHMMARFKADREKEPQNEP